MKAVAISVLVLALPLVAQEAAPSGTYQSAEDFVRFAAKLRESALAEMEPKVVVPATDGPDRAAGRYPWKTSIVTQIFYVGERDGGSASAWDNKWAENFGGFDNPDPAARRDFCPVNFVPRLNPFYCALPYNDVSGTHLKPEARKVIPWFAPAFEHDSKSVCHNRWLAIRKGSRVCYAQWSDVGPFRSDHWEYVFGNERPKPNANHGAGLSVSPAVRDYLGLQGSDVTDWKFVEVSEVPAGPWARYGENNTTLKQRSLNGESDMSLPRSSTPGPAVISR